MQDNVTFQGVRLVLLPEGIEDMAYHGRNLVAPLFVRRFSRIPPHYSLGVGLHGFLMGFQGCFIPRVTWRDRRVRDARLLGLLPQLFELEVLFLGLHEPVAPALRCGL